MKTILKSLFIISLVITLTASATRGFFSDTETSTGNTFPAGQLDLQIDYQGYYNKEADGSPNAGDWSFTDLTAEKFFDFSALKPGDYGEGTISLHVYQNDAWACLTIDNMQSDDNDCTDPEKEAEGGDCGQEGELADSLYFFVWADDGDNIYEPPEEQHLFSNIYGSASDVLDGKTYPLADSTTGGNLLDVSGQDAYLLESKAYFLGLSWCMGAMTVDTDSGVISCNGNSVGSEVQSDSVVADISFYIEQARNNQGFVCGQQPSLTPTPTEQSTPTPTEEQTLTPTPTVTFTPAATATPTPTPTATMTPTPTITPTPTKIV